jgi:trk system potassium uptake protein TrkA
MKIVIAGGTAEADFLLTSLSDNHRLKIINPDREYARYLSDSHRLPVTCGDPRKAYVLSESDIRGYDVLIALLAKDADNLAVCQLAKEKFGIKKTVAVVTNPRNVDLFKIFGVTEVVSSAWMVAERLAQLSTLESLVHSISLENGKIVLTELDVTADSDGSDTAVADMKLPPQVIIACVIRNGRMLIPNGKTIIKSGDHIAVLSPSEIQNRLLKLFTVEKHII